MVTLIPVGTILMREHLADIRCACGRDHDFVFSPVCHVDAPMVASFNKHTGVLSLDCAVCSKLVAKIAVASLDDASQMVN
jgi:hypothetical protein